MKPMPEGDVSNDIDQAAGGGGGTSSASNKALGIDLSQDGKFVIDGQRLYNLAIHNNYDPPIILQ